jgi:hypothetical protein
MHCAIAAKSTSQIDQYLLGYLHYRFAMGKKRDNEKEVAMKNNFRFVEGFVVFAMRMMTGAFQH